MGRPFLFFNMNAATQNAIKDLCLEPPNALEMSPAIPFFSL
jgi:hypothetical protein